LPKAEAVMSGISASGRFCDGLIALTLTLVHDDRGVHLLVSLAESCRGSNRSNNVDCTRKIPYNALREPGKNSNVEKAYRVKRVQDCTNLLHYQSEFLSPLWYDITQFQKMPKLAPWYIAPNQQENTASKHQGAKR
jgi:hypothetical protein